MADKAGIPTVIFLVILGLAMTGGSALLTAVGEGSQKWVGLAGLAFLGFGLAVFVYQLFYLITRD